jgi:hypothetical protein
MITTPDLIAGLSTNVTAVRRLRPPLVRATWWLLLAALVLVLVAIGHGVRPNLAERMHDMTYLTELAGSLLTGALAAIAAFHLSLPDRSRWWLVAPALPFVAWLSTVGHQCLTNWVAIGPDGMRLGETAECLATLGLTSLPLSLGLVVMLRYAAPLRPSNVILLGSLAVAGITSTALTLFHPLDASALILMFNLGPVFVLGGVALVVDRVTGRA